MFSNKTILFTAAHPDDIEFSCGGLIQHIYQNNNKIYFYIFTSGGRFGGPLIRLYEAIQIKKQYPNIKIIIDNYKDDFLNLYYEFKVLQIDKILNNINADYIFTHFPEDIKQDHSITSLIITEYAKKHNKKLFYYESYSIKEKFFKPNYFIEFNWKQKEQLLLNFPSQFGGESLNLAKCRALRNGKNNNMHYAEAYKIIN